MPHLLLAAFIVRGRGVFIVRKWLNKDIASLPSCTTQDVHAHPRFKRQCTTVYTVCIRALAEAGTLLC